MLKNIKTHKHLKPGENGTRRLLEKYGDTLLCVRYRFDEKRGVRLKTVEIIVEEKPLRHARHKDDDIVPVTVLFEETDMRELLRNNRARWDPQAKVWWVRYGVIRGTALEARVVTTS